MSAQQVALPESLAGPAAESSLPIIMNIGSAAAVASRPRPYSARRHEPGLALAVRPRQCRSRRTPPAAWQVGTGCGYSYGHFIRGGAHAVRQRRRGEEQPLRILE